MLDVHAPHGRLAGFKEILLHLFVITLGLLIATQIEACEQWREHLHLAAEARASLRAEIEHNLADLKGAEPELQKWRKEVSADLAAMQRIQDNPRDEAAQHASLEIGAHGMELRNTAWQTAQSTGALAYMPYSEAQKYAAIYQGQQRLLALQNLPAEDAANAFGLVAKFGMKENGRFSAEQAAALSQVFGAEEFHLADAAAVLRENVELNQAFLEGREPQGNFNEPVK